MHTTVAAGIYDPPLSDLITQFKYQRKLEAGRVLTGRLISTLQHHYRAKPWPDLLIPVPLHPARLRERGYNQAALMGRDLSKALQIPLAVDAVHRHRATPAQQGLSARERRRNLRGAFAVNPDWKRASVQRIALIDDVVTTMSTVAEVARELQHHCDVAPEIHVWCLARA
ncbi:MAG: ComF family protein [Pseudomonadota bacterium]